MSKKLNIIFILFIIFCSTLYADVISDFKNFKLKLYNQTELENTNYLNLILDFEKEHENEIKKLTEEKAITLENMLLLEKLNFSNSENNISLVFSQNKKNENFLSDKKIKKLSSEYLVSFADLKSRYLSYLSGSSLINESNNAKKYYKQAISNNKKNIDGYIGYALYLYFAPAIAGGGAKPALKMLLSGEKFASDLYDKYFLLIYKSQMYLAIEDIDKTVQCLDQAHGIIKNETLSLSLKEKIDLGRPFFDE